MVEKKENVMTEAEINNGIANIKAIWGIENMPMTSEDEEDCRAIMRGEKKPEDFIAYKK